MTRALGSAAAAPVSVLWAYWSFAGAALTFPLQHWIARSVVAHAGERSVRSALPGVLGWSLVAGLVTFGASWLGPRAALRLGTTVVPPAGRGR